LHLSVSEVEVGGRRLFAGIMRDLSASRALEAQFLRAQKMETIGTLAGGVSHDFNNLLTSIRGSVELALTRPASDPVTSRSLEGIALAAARGEALTKQLLSFSRKQVSRPEVIDLGLAVRKARELFERVLKEDVVIGIDLDDEAGSVHIDPGTARPGDPRPGRERP
jgi:signal transduction histidine kinase